MYGWSIMMFLSFPFVLLYSYSYGDHANTIYLSTIV